MENQKIQINDKKQNFTQEEIDALVEEMKVLTEKINRASYQYYVLDNPIISDKEWDEMYYRLLDIEKMTGIVLADSPSVKVGGEVLSGFKKVTHSHKLYSLAKAQSLEEIVDWNTRNQNIHNFDEEYYMEYKFDGLSLCITYKDGKLFRAATRGNGEIGEDVTEQVKTIRTVPLSIDFKGEIDVQGEGIIKLSELERYNQKTDEKLKNARNAVAGAIRNLDPKVTASRRLDFFAYNINYCPEKEFLSQEEIYEFLKEQGFLIGDYYKIAHNIDEIGELIKEVEGHRSSLDYLIDGLVIKINKSSVRDKLGFTEKTPRWAVAYKFEAEETSTILNDITWQVGRTGKVTPVAELEATELCGVTIKRATLNNYNDILRKKVKLGDRVFIRRSNDVIPEILSFAETYETSKEIEKPSTCPCCGSILFDTGIELYCQNHAGCKTQIVHKLAHFASRNAMNIEGLSVKTLNQLYDKFAVKNFSDIYKITSEQLSELDGFKDKKITNILSSIEKSKDVKFANFIFALGIDGVGIKTAKNLAKKYKTLNALMKASVEDLIMLDDIAEIMATDIHGFFCKGFNQIEIEQLMKMNIKIETEEEKQSVGGYFAGKKVVFTGTLVSMKRSEAEKLVEEQGGSAQSSVSSATNIVVYGDGAGSKLDKAKKLGLETMTEEEFLKKINQ